MRKYLCIYLPMWAVNLARRRLIKSGVLPDKAAAHPVLLVTQAANQIIVKRCCHECLARGVRSGMTAALAKALASGAHTVLFDPLRDFATLQKLAAKLTILSPLAAIDSELSKAARVNQLADIPPLYNGLILDLSGTDYVHSRVFGNERNLLRFIQRRLAAAAIESRLALAPTIGAAWALSRFAPESMTIAAESSEIAKILNPLPLEALRLPQAAATALRQIGVRRIQELLTLPRKSVGLRFGIETVRRLDQALGAVSETLSAVQEIKTIAHSQEFETPLTRHEELLTALSNGLQELLERLRQIKQKPVSLRIRIEAFGLPPQFSEKEIALLSGTNDIAQLLAIITPIVEKIRFKEGVAALQLKALHTEKTRDKQIPFLKRILHATDEYSVSAGGQADILNNLAARLGKEKISNVTFNHSYIPERSFSFRPLQSDKHGVKENNFPAALLKHQPPYLLSTPEPIQAIAMLPDKPPSWIKWRNEKLLVLSGFGPSRISDEWWRTALSTESNDRDYFRIQDQCGRWLWIFREQRTLAWFVHGIWI